MQEYVKKRSHLVMENNVLIVPNSLLTILQKNVFQFSAMTLTTLSIIMKLIDVRDVLMELCFSKKIINVNLLDL